MFRKTQEEPLKSGHAFAFCRASFLMTFATGGIPHAGSQQLGDQQRASASEDTRLGDQQSQC